LERVSVFDRGRGLRAAALAITALGASCAANPVTGQREFALTSEAQELALNREPDTQNTSVVES
jgi:hypothetical protein